MIHMKAIKFPDFKKAAALAILIIMISIGIKSLFSIGNVQALQQSSNEPDKIYKIMINKALPILDTNQSEPSEGSYYFLSYLFKNIIKLDISNPKTYLTSQIPLLGIFDIKEGFIGSVSALQSSPNASPAAPQTPAQNAYNSNFDDLPVENPKIDYNNPAVVIYHTHATESFTPTAEFNYDNSQEDYRTTDKNLNICKIGEEVKNYIEKYYGMAVINDTTLHDYPNFNGCYNRSRVTIESLVKKYPNAKFYIDMHRDANIPRDKMVINLKNDQAAKIMFVIGKGNPHWQENYQLSQKLNQKIEELYPGLSRGIDVKQALYNQDVSNKVILIEIGGDVNTMEEAIIAGRMFGRALGKYISGQ